MRVYFETIIFQCAYSIDKFDGGSGPAECLSLLLTPFYPDLSYQIKPKKIDPLKKMCLDTSQ